jgi:hypothetical protein
MRNQQTALEGKIEGTVTRLAALLVLWVWVFWSEMPNLGMKIPNSSNDAHSLVIPAAILLLVFLRRSALAAGLTKGSAWGILFLTGGIAMYAAATWPFSYGYVRDIAVIPILAGIILVTCGWRILKFSLPMLLLVFLSIPIPNRLYAALIIRPETYTIAATAKVLDKLPAVNIIVKGIDLIFSSGYGTGVIALGESNRGARLLLAFATIGVFTAFSQIRSVWRLAIVAIAAMPIILFCNFFRLFCWGLVVIYTHVSPTSGTARNIAAICSMLLAYALFVFICTIRFNIFVEVDEEQKNTNIEEDAYG